MAQTNRLFPFNTVGDAYGKNRNKDVKDRAVDALDEVANVKTSPIHQWIASESLFRLFHCH